MHVRNVLYTGVVLLLLISPALLFFLQNAVKADLPPWLTAEDSLYLEGGQKTASIEENFSLDGIFSGGFQDAVQTKIGNYIPAKAACLLGNAALERRFIEASNSIFRWDCYPTFYGSIRQYVPEFNTLCNFPLEHDEDTLDQISLFSTSLCEFAQQNPEINFYIVLPDMLQTLSISPVVPLVSNYISTDDILDAMRDSLSTADNVFISCKRYETFPEYLSEYYLTDGHWNGYGSISAFNELRQYGFSAYPPVDRIRLDPEEFVINGQNARTGLMLLDEPMNEPALEVFQLSVDPESPGYVLQRDRDDLIVKAGAMGEFNFYPVWYGDGSKHVIAPNQESGNALLVSDSFGEAFRWMLASSYRQLNSVMELGTIQDPTLRLRDRLEDYGSQSVFFVGTPRNFSLFMERYPDYFDCD